MLWGDVNAGPSSVSLDDYLFDLSLLLPTKRSPSDRHMLYLFTGLD